MSATIAIPKRRITGGMKAVMLTIALMFDAAIILMVIGAFVLAVGVGGVVAEKVEEKAMGNCKVESLLDISGMIFAGVDAVGRGVFNKSFCKGQAELSGATSGAVAGAVIGGGFMMFFPIFAAIVSAFAAFTSVLLFTAWFYALRVNVWGMKLSKIGLNMLTFVIESIPVLNLAPMQTINVWGHIRIAKKEDDAAIEKATAKLRAQETRNGFMQGRAPRKPSRDAVNQQMASEGVFAA